MSIRVLFVYPSPCPYMGGVNLKDDIYGAFGYCNLQKTDGIEIDWYCVNQQSLLFKMFKKIPFIKEIMTQTGCITKQKNYDVIYCGRDMHLLPLAIYRKLGLIYRPILIVSHFSYNTQYKTSLFLRFFKKIERHFVFTSIDRITFACQALLDTAKRDFTIPEKYQLVSSWGANMSFYDRRIFNKLPSYKYFLAAGGNNRDYTSLIEAFRKVPSANLLIFGKYKSIPQNIHLPHNVTINKFEEGTDAITQYKKLREAYYNCIAVCLPIKELNDVPNGATVLVEALAMGKPIIITEADTNFIDVNKEGCGITVQRSSIDGWINAVRFFMENQKEAIKMGDAAYKLAQEVYNMENFSQHIAKLLKEMTQ